MRDPALIPLPTSLGTSSCLRSGPRVWFAFAESHFWLCGINDEQQNFNHVLSALPAEMVSQVIHLLDTLPQTNPYEYFKTQLLDIHQLSDYEKFFMLTKMQLMGGRKPSQLFHAMLEFCPVGMESISLLPLLLHAETSPGSQKAAGRGAAWRLRALAARADKLWSVYSAAKGGTVPSLPSRVVTGGVELRARRDQRRAEVSASGRPRPCSYRCPCRRSYSLRPCQGLFPTL